MTGIILFVLGLLILAFGAPDLKGWSFVFMGAGIILMLVNIFEKTKKE